MIAITISGEEYELSNFAAFSIILLFPLPHADISSSGNYSEIFIANYHHHPGYGLDGLGFIPGSTRFFLFSTATRPALEPTQPHIKWVPGSRPPGVKWQEYEANHSPPSIAEVKKGGAMPPLPHTCS
jgi:hypothetical protein